MTTYIFEDLLDDKEMRKYRRYEEQYANNL